MAEGSAGTLGNEARAGGGRTQGGPSGVVREVGESSRHGKVLSVLRVDTELTLSRGARWAPSNPVHYPESGK